MEIFVDDFDGKNFTVYMGASDRFVDLKAKIQAETDVRGDGKAIKYAGRRMRMNWRLSSYGLRDGCTIRLTPRAFYHRSQPSCFVDVENKDALQRIPLQYGTGQEWSRVDQGLSIEGTCSNLSCQAFSRRVISPVRFDYVGIPREGRSSFNIKTDKAPCPACRCTVKATSCGFIDCEWMYTGRLKESKAETTSEWQLADDDKYVRFCEAGNMVDWEVLIILAKRSLNREECHMCLCGMDFTAKKERLACGCRFHSRCVAEWNECETGCPNCRLDESASHSPMPGLVEVSGSKQKERKSFWGLCQG